MKIPSLLLAALFCFAVQSTSFANSPADSDGDGVNDYREGKDGTDPNNAASFDPLSKGLVALYTFNGTFQSNAGLGADAIPRNSVNFVPDNKFGTVVKVQGADSVGDSGGHIELPEPALLSKTTFSASFWIKEHGFSYQHGEAYLQAGTGAQSRALLAHFGDYTQKPYYFWTQSTLDQNGHEGTNYQISAEGISDNWNQYIITETNGLAKIYRNGLEIYTATTSGAPLGNWHLGRHWWDGGSSQSTRLIASLANLRIYNRALSATEVSQLYAKESGTNDFDNDGVNDYREGKDGTDPNNAASLNPLSKGLVAFYPFDGNAKDESGKNNHLTLLGSSLGQDRFGDGNSSLAVELGKGAISTNNLGIAGNSDRTICFWMKPTTTPVWPDGHIIEWGMAGGNHGAGRWTSVVYIPYYAGGPDGINLALGGFYADASVLASQANFLGEWKSVVVVYSGSQFNTQFYVNGVLQMTNFRVSEGPGFVTELDTIDSTLVLNAASKSGGFGNNGGITGLIDDVRIYNRALSATEVSQLYAKESGASNAFPASSAWTLRWSGNNTKAGNFVRAWVADGSVWLSHYAIKHRSGKFIAGGIYSDEGLDWKTFTLPNNVNHWLNESGVAGNTFILNGAGNDLWSSQDGVNWTKRSNPGGYDDLCGIEFGNDTILVNRYWSPGSLLVSKDRGSSWSFVDTGSFNFAPGTDSRNYEQTVFGSGKFLFPLFDSVRTSADGMNWQTTSITNRPSAFRLSSVRNFDAKTQKFVGVQQTASNATTKTITTAVSSDGVNWTFREATIPTTQSGEFYGTSVGQGFVVAGAGTPPEMWMSADEGQNWSRINGPWEAPGVEGVAFAASPTRIVAATPKAIYSAELGQSPPDTTAPVVSVTSITANARLTSANATFSGSVVETGSKPSLEFRLGTTGNWTASSVGGEASPYSFSQRVTLKAGPNTVQFRAKDEAGNTSQILSVPVSFVVSSVLSIAAPKAVDGSISPGFGGNSTREVGVRYTVTATPASGMLFKEWLKNGTRISTNASLTFTMEPGLKLVPVFVPDYAKLGGFYNGLVGTGEMGSGTTADRQSFAARNGFLQIRLGSAGALSGFLRIEGGSHPFSGSMGNNKRATITVARPGKTNAVLNLNLVSALPGEISGTLGVGGVSVPFKALRGGNTPGMAKHALGGKRYALVFPPPEGVAMGHGHGTLSVGDDGSAVLAGVLANGQAVNAAARVVDDGKGNWVVPVYVGGTGIFTGEIVIPKTTPASGSEIGGSLEWLKPASNRGLFRQGFLKAVQPLGASHNATSAGLGGAEFQLTLDPAKRILPAAVVQNGSWPNGAAPVLATPVKSGLTITFNSLSGRFEGRFNRTVAGVTVPTPFQGTLFSRPISIPGGATLRGAGFFTSGNASTAVEITSDGTVPVAAANMITVQGGTLPSGSELAGQTVATFQIGKYEVTWGEWKAVRDWAVANGYSDLVDTGSSDGIPPGRGKGEKNPVTTVSWYDAVKWCNARSEMENIVPVYRNSNGSIYKTSEGEPITLNSANGYRLPTETEWEWAARGGILSQGYVYSGGNDLNSVAVGYGGDQPVGTKTGNELGIHDMSGNVSEWVWDSVDPPSGSPYKIYRTYRGGDSFQSPNLEICKVAFRATGGTLPFNRPGNFGIRLARNAGN